MTSRRELLLGLAAVSGVSAAWTAARAMGLIEGEESWSGAPNLAPDSGKGATVVILGAGLAGLSAAYELRKAGYDCTVLEARDRTGGRNLTLRCGNVVEMTDGTRQVCEFDDGQYFNAGPARLPSHHQATLGYCRELGVAVEPLINHSDSGLLQADNMNGGKPIQMRQAIHDTRGHMAELLAKATRNGGLDRVMSAEDRDMMMANLAAWGALRERGGAPRRPRDAGPVAGELSYLGSEGAGFSTEPAAGAQSGTLREPLPLSTLMHPIVRIGSGFHEFIDMQATMLAPTGGMDRIPAAFEKSLGPIVRKGCAVKRIARKGKGVQVTYLDKAAGAERRIVADYCLVTIPLKVLSDIPADFSADRKQAIARAVYESAIKIAFQSPRFWETEAQIYGGLSFTGRDTFITWYPSSELQSPEGVLVAGYAFGEQADRFAALPLADRIAYARGTVDRLHPGKSGLLKAPITVTWKAMPHSLGIACPLAEQDRAAYDLLSEADGPFYFAGEHLSHVGAWQQGAFVSAHRAVAMLDARHRQGRPVTQGRPQ